MTKFRHWNQVFRWKWLFMLLCCTNPTYVFWVEFGLSCLDKLQVVFRYWRATCASWTWLTSRRAHGVDIWWAPTSSVCGADSKTITSLINNNVKYRFILAILSELTPMMTCPLFWVCVFVLIIELYLCLIFSVMLMLSYSAIPVSLISATCWLVPNWNTPTFRFPAG